MQLDQPGAVRDAQTDKVARSHELVHAVLVRSTTDAAFRAELLANPRAAIASHAGKPASALSESFNVRFIENSSDATIVLPDFQGGDAALSDQQLETVAGGVGDLQDAIAQAVAPVLAPVAAWVVGLFD
ncbi:MAG TPA: hypothetical protein VN706_15310 [Gemmatimonadaceae bacterium]|nr:hypothetical protein [Gemmatimonadaceae bacterium]